MSLRQDALCAAAEWALSVESIARHTDELVATVGSVKVSPDAVNIVPGKATLSLWAQSVVAFDTFAQAFDFSEPIAASGVDEATFEWPIPSFLPGEAIVREGKTLIFFMIAEQQRERLEAAARVPGRSDLFRSVYRVAESPLLSDYTWNHTTLWAMKFDPEYTYLQCGFDPAGRLTVCAAGERFGQ